MTPISCFQNPDWAVRASQLLDELAVVQLADRIVRLPEASLIYNGEGQVWDSFAAVCRQHPNAALLGEFGRHGHTGFGWAARRSVLDHAGFYDACIAGGGDHVMAHAFCGDWESACLTRMMGPDSAWYRHAVAWATKVYPLVKARLGAVDGAALHLWHGDIASRGHVLRYELLHRAGFNPDQDLESDQAVAGAGLPANLLLHAGMNDYMAGRRVEATAARFPAQK